MAVAPGAHRGPQRPRAPAPASVITPGVLLGSGPSAGVVVEGCRDDVVGPMIRGRYSLQSENHGKPVYRRDERAGEHDVMIYFWDDRSSPIFCGWWFGPKVGGDQVWAFHPDRKIDRPPQSGWRVPFDGDIDQSVVLQDVVAGSVNAQAQQRPSANNNKQTELARNGGTGDAASKPCAQVEPRKDAPLLAPPATPQSAPPAVPEAKKPKLDEQASESAQKSKRESKAVLAIRRVLMRVKMAKPENVDELKSELEEVLSKEASLAGSQEAKIREEAAKALAQATARVKGISERLQKMEEHKEQAESKKRDREEARKEACAEVNRLVAAMETNAGELQVKEQHVLECVLKRTDLGQDDASKIERDIAGVRTHGETLEKECSECIRRHRDILLPIGVRGDGSGGCDSFGDGATLIAKAEAAARSWQAAACSANAASRRISARLTARDFVDRQRASFEKYDVDGDGVLNRQEVLAYAKGVHGLVIPQDLLDRIFRNLVVDGQPGVPADNFQALKVAIGIGRELERDARRAVLAAEERRRVEEQRQVLREQVADAKEAFNALETSVVEVETAVSRLQARRLELQAARSATDGQDRTGLDELVLEVDGLDTRIDALRADLNSKGKQLEGLADPEGSAYTEFASWLRVELKRISMHSGRLDVRLGAVTTSCNAIRQSAKPPAEDISPAGKDAGAESRTRSRSRTRQGEKSA